MRLFVGIALPPDVRQSLEQWLTELRRSAPALRWSPPQQWHVTLQFLGETAESRYTCIVDALRAIETPQVAIELAQPGFFERAGIFHVAVKTTPSLLQAQKQVTEGLRQCGFEPEARAYSPHITLARRKGSGRSPEFERLKKIVRGLPEFSTEAFIAEEFLLYQSFTGPAGSTYEVRERFALM